MILLPLASKALYDTTGIPTAVYSFGADGNAELVSSFERMQTEKENPDALRRHRAALAKDTPEKPIALELFRSSDEFMKNKGYKTIGTMDGSRYSWKTPDNIVTAIFTFFNDLSRLEKKLGEDSTDGSCTLWSRSRCTPGKACVYCTLIGIDLCFECVDAGQEPANGNPGRCVAGSSA